MIENKDEYSYDRAILRYYNDKIDDIIEYLNWSKEIIEAMTLRIEQLEKKLRKVENDK